MPHTPLGTALQPERSIYGELLDCLRVQPGEHRCCVQPSTENVQYKGITVDFASAATREEFSVGIPKGNYIVEAAFNTGPLADVIKDSTGASF
jgi:hypothetical protein